MMKISRRQALKLIAVSGSSLWFSSCSTAGKRALASYPPADTLSPEKNITVAMLGATGMAGSYILSEALVQGYKIRALARTPDKLKGINDRISIIQGDARDISAIRELLQGSDVVISALGPVKSDGQEAMGVCTAATGHIIQVMQQQHINRYILLSGAALAMPGDNRSLKGLLIQKLAQITLSSTVRDKITEYQLLEHSPLQWTLVRCPIIDTEVYKRKPMVSLETPMSFHLRAGELASFVIAQIDSNEYLRKGPFLGSR